MAKAKFRFIRIICLMGIVGMGLILFVACESDDGESVSEDGTGTIFIRNYDNKDYRVELRLTSDDTVLGVLSVDDYDFFDDNWMASFEDVPEGMYYLVIFSDDTEVDRSSNFSIDEDDTDCYRINDDGRFKTC